jgi:hypothetical protein
MLLSRTAGIRILCPVSTSFRRRSHPSKQNGRGCPMAIWRQCLRLFRVRPKNQSDPKSTANVFTQSHLRPIKFNVFHFMHLYFRTKQRDVHSFRTKRGHPKQWTIRSYIKLTVELIKKYMLYCYKYWMLIVLAHKSLWSHFPLGSVFLKHGNDRVIISKSLRNDLAFSKLHVGVIWH